MSEYLPHIFRTLDRSQKKIKPDVLLTKLKTWRRARSALLGIPPFKIASNDGAEVEAVSDVWASLYHLQQAAVPPVPPQTVST